MAGRILVGAAIAIVLLLVAAQLFLPGYASKRIEDRLTDGGGTASASIESFPAARLVFGDGDSVNVSGEGLDLPLNSDNDVFGRLDGFADVEVSLADFRAGPFQIASFELIRDGSGPYRLSSTSTTTAADLVGYGAERLGISGGPILSFLAGQAPEGDRRIPIRLDMELDSDDGRIQVTSGGGTVAGYPTGPLAELITSAIVVRL